MGIHGLVQKGWIYSNKIWQVPWDKNGSTDVGLPMSTLFLDKPMFKGICRVVGEGFELGAAQNHHRSPPVFSTCVQNEVA
jgi:hypothetical protein